MENIGGGGAAPLAQVKGKTFQKVKLLKLYLLHSEWKTYTSYSDPPDPLFVPAGDIKNSDNVSRMSEEFTSTGTSCN